MNPTEVKGFQGDFRFLSNFYPYEVEFEGHKYKSSEAAYQAQKCPDRLSEFLEIDARAAKRLGQQVNVRPDWEAEKLNIMYRILRVKFAAEPLRPKLLATKGAYLEETNYWHDTFWGVYNGTGSNHLGRLLMVVRDELKEGII